MVWKSAALLALLPVAGFGAQQEPAEAPESAGEEVDGQALLEENCLACHDDSYIVSSKLSREHWDGVLDLMLGMGMPPLAPEIRDQLLDYLSTEYGPDEPGDGSGSVAAEAEAPDLPWATPRYPPNPLDWKKP